MEILTYIFDWLPEPFKSIVLGLIALVVVIAIIRLIGKILDALPIL